MMNPATCGLLAQVVPVFLLVFAVRGSQLVRSVQEARQPHKHAGWKRVLTWVRSERIAWLVITFLFLAGEAWAVGASDGSWPMPQAAAYTWFGLVLLYAWIEMASLALPGDEAGAEQS